MTTKQSHRCIPAPRDMNHNADDVTPGKTTSTRKLLPVNVEFFLFCDRHWRGHQLGCTRMGDG